MYIDDRQATPEQREQLQHLFRETLIQVYSGGLSMAKDQKVRILPRGQNDGTEAIVRTGMSSISDPGKPEVQMVYRLRNIKDQGWKVIDVNVEACGLSAIIVTSTAISLHRKALKG